jgi:hypothetical protein
MFVMFTDELFQAFETCNTLTGLWYGQEELGYPVLLIQLECCTINICAAEISQKVISLQHPTAQGTMKVKLAAQVMSHTLEASLNALVATGEGHCTCILLCSLMKGVVNENNEG